MQWRNALSKLSTVQKTCRLRISYSRQEGSSCSKVYRKSRMENQLLNLSCHSYLKTLEAENRALKRRRLEETSNDSQSGHKNPSRQLLETHAYQPSLPRNMERGSFRPLSGQPSRIGSEAPDSTSELGLAFAFDENYIQPRYSGEASCETFGGRLHQYINHGERRPPPRSYPYYKNPKLLRISSTECNLPNKNYAKLLVRAVLQFIGGDHHLLLRKSFLRKLDETYQLEILDDPVWLCRLYTVLALGELYSIGRSGSTRRVTGVPGTAFFVRAMGFFQDMHEEPTVAYIETLLLLVRLHP